MVERSEKQHRIGARVRQPECPCVADLRAGESAPRSRTSIGARLLDVQRNRIHEMDFVATFRQPDRVRPGPPPTSAMTAGGDGR